MKLKDKLELKSDRFTLENTEFRFRLLSSNEISELKKIMKVPPKKVVHSEDGIEEIPDEVGEEKFGEDMAICIFYNCLINPQHLGIEAKADIKNRQFYLSVKEELLNDLGWGDTEKIFNIAQMVYYRDPAMFEDNPFLLDAVENGSKEKSSAKGEKTA